MESVWPLLAGACELQTLSGERVKYLILIVAIGFLPIRLMADGIYDLAGPLCKGVTNMQNCAKKIEDKAIKKVPFIYRKDGVLVIDINKVKHIQVEFGDTKGKSYNYMKSFDESNLHLVRVQLHEGSSYKLIVQVSGQVFDIQDIPVFTTDFNYFVTASMDIDAGYNPNAIQVWKKAGVSWEKEFNMNLKAWGVKNPRWIANEKIELEKYEGLPPKNAGFVTIVKVGSKWKYSEYRGKK